MGNYVSITSSPSDLINAADKIRDRGMDLALAVDGIVADIRDHETDTFPSDQYSDTFVNEKYHLLVPGADGNDQEAATAVTEAGKACGSQMRQVGEYVSKAMVSYDVADMDNASQITKQTVTHTATRTG